VEDSVKERTHIAALVLVVFLGLMSTVACKWAGMTSGEPPASPAPVEPGRYPSPTSWSEATPTNTPVKPPTGTPTTTATPGSSVKPAGPTARAGTPTMTPDPKWTPAPRTLGKDVPTMPVTADSLFTGVTIYFLDSSGANSFVYEVMGRAENCPSMPSGRGVMLRRFDGVPYWTDRDVLVNYLARPSANPVVIRADDPGLKAKQWVSYPCP
jgi:hypothetical protein